MNPIATVAKASRTRAKQRAINKLPPDTGAPTMNLTDSIRHMVARSIHKGGNRRGESRVIEDAAITLIADDITAEVMDVMAMYTHNHGGEE
jgi:hypothetical protein